MGSQIKEVLTTCTRDCPDTCGMVAEVANGQVLRLKGAPGHPVTRGFLCPKMYAYPRMLASSQRLTAPLVRRGGTFVPISFAEAYDLAAGEVEKAVQRYGSNSILLYQLSGSLAVLNTLSQRFFNLLGGATRNVGGLCLANAIKGQELDFGQGRLGHSPLDVANSGTILFWGRNAADTNPHLFYQATAARQKGAVLVTVDPRGSRTSRQSDLHVPVKPGTDWALALLLVKGLLTAGALDPQFLKDNPDGRQRFLKMVSSYSEEELLQEVGVAPQILRELLSYLINKGPVAIYLGVGMTYWPRGVETVRLINALGAVLGTLEERGGGVNLSHSGWRFFDQSLTGPKTGERPVFEPSLAKEMLSLKDPPLKMAWVVAGNPLAQVPNSHLVDKAFSSLDFVIVNELFMTDTALKAHLIFPVSSFLERSDALGSWGHNLLSPVNPAVETSLPSDLEVFQNTARRLGIEKEMAGTAAEWLERFLMPLNGHGITWEKLKEGWVKNPLLPDIPSFNQYGFNIITSFPGDEEDSPKPGEFYLLTPKPRHQTHSQKLPSSAAKAALLMSPGDAAALHIEGGEVLQVTSCRGSLLMEARIDPSMTAGTVAAYSGGWHCEGQGVNVLTGDQVTGAGGMTINGTRVRLAKVPLQVKEAGSEGDSPKDLNIS